MRYFTIILLILSANCFFLMDQPRSLMEMTGNIVEPFGLGSVIIWSIKYISHLVAHSKND